MSDARSDTSDTVLLDKTKDPALERLGYPVVATTQEYSEYIQRVPVSTVLVHFAQIDPDDCLYLYEVNELFKGSLVYFGIESDDGSEHDDRVRGLIGPELDFEKTFAKTHTKQQIDYLIRFSQKKRALEENVTLHPKPNKPPSKKHTVPASRGKSTKTSGTHKLKPTHIIFACLVATGTLTLGYITHIMMDSPQEGPVVASTKSDADTENDEAPPTAIASAAQPPYSQRTKPQSSSTQLGPSQVEPDREQVADAIPRLPSTSTTEQPDAERLNNNGLAAGSVTRNQKSAVNTPSQNTAEPEVVVTSDTEAPRTHASKAKEAEFTSQTQPSLASSAESEQGDKQANTIDEQPEPSQRGSSSDVEGTSENDPRNDSPPDKSKDQNTATSVAVLTPTETQSEPSAPQRKTSVPVKKPAPKPTPKAPVRKPLPVLTAAQEQKVSQFNALAITQIQQKIYLPATRKSALYFFNQIYELAGPNRTVKSLANNITGNILEDATDAIKKRDAVALERAVKNLRAVERHIRGLSSEIHQQSSYQRLLRRYHRSITRSEPILSPQMSNADRENFRQALKHLRALLKELCNECSALA